MHPSRWTLQSILDYFGVDKPWDVGWAHGVNRSAFLSECLSDPGVMMLEGDILRDGNGKLLMAHPPVTEVDTTFREWLAAIEGAAAAGKRKGAKLDFKNPDSVEECLRLAASSDAPAVMPVFVNADVVGGPNCREPYHDGREFIRLCASYLPGAVLSLGFCVGERELGDESHMSRMMREMLDLCGLWPGHVTVCLCSSYLNTGYDLIEKHLLPTRHSLTLWNYEPVSPELATWIRDHFDPDQTFYDFKDEAGRPVRL